MEVSRTVEIDVNPTEYVVLLDESGASIGVAAKDSVHTETTLLHAAFSLYGFNEQGQVLLTRRALTKRTWPGAWTNTCCGHPGPDETDENAILRRVEYELGLSVVDLQVVVPDFRYRAEAPDGIVENEICPVYFGRLVGHPSPRPTEVSELAWCPLDRFDEAIRATPFAFSPWAGLQMNVLRESGWVR
jgi:isopentenyl-diphosphate delta-isomerase type 1